MTNHYPMIKQLLCLLCSTAVFFMILSTPVAVNAQNPTPNAGFEDWTLTNLFNTSFYVPNSWDNLDSASAFIGFLTCLQTTDKHSGNFAVKLVTTAVTSINDTVNGIVTTGQLIITPPYGIQGGIPYHERPDSIAGWMKYTPVGGDSTQIQFDLLANNGDTIGTALAKIGATITSYTRFTAPVKYKSAATPDVSRWMISSSNGYKAMPGSTLLIDDLSLLFTTGIHTIESSSGMQLINSLVTNEIILSNPKHLEGQLLLYNAMGALVATFPVKQSSEQIRLLHLENGIYFCQVKSHEGASLLRRKIIVQQ